MYYTYAMNRDFQHKKHLVATPPLKDGKFFPPLFLQVRLLSLQPNTAHHTL